MEGAGELSSVTFRRALIPFTRVPDRKSTRLNSSHLVISYAVFCLKKKKYIFRLLAADATIGNYNPAADSPQPAHEIVLFPISHDVQASLQSPPPGLLATGVSEHTD